MILESIGIAILGIGLLINYALDNARDERIRELEAKVDALVDLIEEEIIAL